MCPSIFDKLQGEARLIIILIKAAVSARPIPQCIIIGNTQIRPQLLSPFADADIISIYTVDDGVEDGILFDVTTQNSNEVLPTVMVPLHPKFPLGRIVTTPGALELVEQDMDISKALHRHAHGDWGDLDAGDARSNDHALKHNDGRLFSSYQHFITEHDENGAEKTYAVKLWIITEHDRSVTTLLKPSEY